MPSRTPRSSSQSTEDLDRMDVQQLKKWLKSHGGKIAGIPRGKHTYLAEAKKRSRGRNRGKAYSDEEESEKARKKRRLKVTKKAAAQAPRGSTVARPRGKRGKRFAATSYHESSPETSAADESDYDQTKHHRSAFLHNQSFTPTARSPAQPSRRRRHHPPAASSSASRSRSRSRSHRHASNPIAKPAAKPVVWDKLDSSAALTGGVIKWGPLILVSIVAVLIGLLLIGQTYQTYCYHPLLGWVLAKPFDAVFWALGGQGGWLEFLVHLAVRWCIPALVFLGLLMLLLGRIEPPDDDNQRRGYIILSFMATPFAWETYFLVPAVAGAICYARFPSRSTLTWPRWPTTSSSTLKITTRPTRPSAAAAPKPAPTRPSAAATPKPAPTRPSAAATPKPVPCIEDPHPLHLAALGDDARKLKLLLGKDGVNVDMQSTCGKTPLHCAAMAGNKTYCELLLTSGADPTRLDKEFKTPAMKASSTRLEKFLGLAEKVWNRKRQQEESRRLIEIERVSKQSRDREAKSAPSLSQIVPGKRLVYIWKVPSGEGANTDVVYPWPCTVENGYIVRFKASNNAGFDSLSNYLRTYERTRVHDEKDTPLYFDCKNVPASDISELRRNLKAGWTMEVLTTVQLEQDGEMELGVSQLRAFAKGDRPPAVCQPPSTHGMAEASNPGDCSATYSVTSKKGNQYWWLCRFEDVDMPKAQEVAGCFVHAGKTGTIRAPPGRYHMRFASGNKWYSESYKFGPTGFYGISNDYKTGKLVELGPNSISSVAFPVAEGTGTIQKVGFKFA